MEKSTKNIVSSRFFRTYSYDDSTNHLNLWSYGLISPKSFWIFLWIFSTSGWKFFEKHGIIKRIIFSNQSYASLVLSDSEITVLSGRKGCSLPSISLLSFVYTQRCIIEEECRQIFLTSEGISSRSMTFQLLFIHLF